MTHTHTATAALHRGALAWERPLLSPGTYSSAQPRQDDPGAANSPSGVVAGAFPKHSAAVGFSPVID